MEIVLQNFTGINGKNVIEIYNWVLFLHKRCTSASLFRRKTNFASISPKITYDMKSGFPILLKQSRIGSPCSVLHNKRLRTVEQAGFSQIHGSDKRAGRSSPQSLVLSVQFPGAHLPADSVTGTQMPGTSGIPAACMPGLVSSRVPNCRASLGFRPHRRKSTLFPPVPTPAACMPGLVNFPGAQLPGIPAFPCAGISGIAGFRRRLAPFPASTPAHRWSEVVPCRDPSAADLPQ